MGMAVSCVDLTAAPQDFEESYLYWYLGFGRQAVGVRICGYSLHWTAVGDQ